MFVVLHRDNIYDCVNMLLRVQNIILDAQVKISNQERLIEFIRQQMKILKQ